MDFVEPSEAAPHNATAYDLVRAIITALYHTFSQFHDERRYASRSKMNPSAT